MLSLNKISRIFALLFIVSLSPALALDASANKSGGFSNTVPDRQYTGGFTGAGPKVMTIEQAKALPDDSYATLRGNIVRHEGGDNYVFRDTSGEYRVEIDDDIWRGQHVAPENTVEIIVEVDKEWGFVEFEAEKLTIIK